MPKYKPLYSLYKGLKENKYDVPDSYVSFQKTLTQPGNAGAKSRRGLYQSLKDSNYDVPDTYEDFYKNLFVPVNSTTSRALKIGENPNTPMVNRYRQKMFDSVDPNKNGLNALSHRAVGQAVRATNNVRKPVIAKVVNKKGKPTGEEFAITPAKTVEDLDREYAQAVSKNWENELHDQMADADKDAAKISDMFKSFIGSTDEVGSVWGNMTRGGGIAGTPHSVTTNNGILENTEARQILAAGDYNRKRRELLQLEQDSRNGAIFDNHSFFRGMYDAAKDTGFLTGGASDLINAGSLLATKQDLDNGVHTEAGDMLMQQAVKNSDAQSQYGDNQGWMYTGGVITTNMAPFMVQIGSAGFSKGMSNTIGKAVQGAASKVALGTMEKSTGMAGAHIANYIGKVTGLTTKAFGKAIQYGIVGAAQANTVGLGNVANDVVNRYTGQVYQDEHGDYKFGTFDSDGKLVHEGGEDFLTALVKGEAAQTIEFATELAGGGIDAVGTALKNFVTKGGKKIINKYNMENVSKVIDFLLNNKVAKNARYLKAGADRTLGKVEVNSIVGESLEEELGIIANTVFTGDNKISDLWDEKQQSQIWGGMLLSIGLMKGAVAPFHAYNAKQYYSYKHKLDKADVNLSQLLGKEKWEELRNQIDATTNDDMPEMVNKINRDVALGKSRQPVREYIQNLLIMRGYDIGNMLAAKKAVEDKGEGVSVKNMEKNQAYQQGRDAYGYDTHEIQLDQEDKQKSLAQLLGISEQQLASMSDEELEALSGRDDNIDRAIYDYQLSTARYEGVIDNARDQIDLEVQRAAQAVDMYTDKSRNTIRNATIKATGGLEDYGVYIINGNIATHEDGSIDISNSDDMILYYDPTTNTVEHADAMMFAELGSEENADEVRSQAMADAKEKAIKETTGIIDGVVEVGTQFKTVDADGTEHTYEVLADNGDGTAMITIDGNIPTELVKGENVNVPVSFEELQKMKDESDQQRLQAAKAEREQMEKERTERQNQQTEQTEETQPSFDFNQILNDDGNVVLVDVLDKDSNTKYPNSQLFLIRDSGAKAKVMELTSDGSFIPHAVNKKDVRTATTMTLDEYKQAMAESSMIEDNSGESRGEIEVETPTIEGETAAPESAETPATEQTPAVPAITLEDGTIVPMLEDGNPDFSKLTAAQTAELYDSQFGEDADSIVSGYVSDAKKALDKASNMTVKGKTFVEQKAAKDAKEKAIADAKAAYDSAIAIRDAYNERQLAKVEDTAEGRKELIEKARRKFARLKSAVKDDAEAVAQIYKETVGSLLHRLYDGTGIDVTDTIPLTAEEYVASNLGAHSLNYEGTETSKGVKQETGLSRKDFAETQLLAADGKGTTIDNLVHSLWENRPSNLDSLDTQDIRNALLSIITSGFKASEARNYIENLRIARAENFKEEEKKAADNAAFAKEQKAKQEEEQGETEQENTDKEKNEKINEQTNENINAPEQNKFPDKLREGSKTIEVPEDATDENPLGLQLSEDKVPFEIEGGKSGETYNINDNEDRQRLINDNKVDDKDILDIDMPKHVHKAIKELCKKMGLKVQFLYMGARSNGWIENGTMYLALDTEKATQFVFGHEMTHAIKQKNPEAYKELVKVAMAITTRKKFEEDLAKIYQNYYGISGYNNIDDYVEEVVADKLGKFINDFDLAQKFSLRLNHPVLATILHAIQKIKGLLYGDFYKSVDALERIVEKAYVDTAKGEVTNSETGEDVSFSLRQKPEPKKKGIGYKVFVLKDGKLYPPMVANPDGAATPVGVWLDADAAPIAGESKTGRPQVKQGGKGTQGGSGKLAYRPGWHLGVVPYAIQFNRKDAEGNKTLFPKNFVFAEVEYAADVDYQEEARQEGINPSGKYQHSLAGLKHLPTDGYYMYRTNPNPETDPWVITGAMKVNRILTRAEQAELVKNAGREPQQIQEGDIVTDDVVNSINQEIADAPKFSLKDNQENPLNQDGTLKLDKIKSVDELTDEDFTSAFRNVELPAIPKNVDAAIGANGKPIVIKKNIFEKNWNAHKFTPAESKKVLNDALYNTDLVGHTQPTKKPNHWVAIKLDEKSPITVLEVNDNKDNVEVVGWYTLDERNLGRIKRQAERNGGELIMLTPKDDKVESLSTPPLSSAAKIDNSSETTKGNGEKFSLKDEKTLAGVHNISEEKLLKAIKQGGLANPSVAVIDSSRQDHKAYGGISLILPSDKIAKRTGKNAGTWQGDAYTPTYPEVEKQMSNKGAEKSSSDVLSVPKEMQHEVRNGIDRWLNGGDANSGLKYLFLHEKGVAPEPKMIQPKFSDEAYNELKFITAGDFNIYGIGKADAQKVLDMYIESKFDGDKDLYEEKTKAWLKRNKSIVDAGAKGGMRYAIAKENVELYDEYGFNYKGVQTFVRDVEYDHRKSGVDTNATLNDVEDYIKTNNLTDEFNTWLEGKEKEYGIKEVIFDGFTPSGNRRYVPNTLENVSKIMKKQGRNGATGAAVSFQNFAARLMPSYGTLKDIRSKKGLLTSDREKFDKFREKWSSVFFELGNKCQPDSTSAFDSYGMERLSEAAMTSDPQAYLKKEYNVDFSDEDTKRLKEMVKAIKEKHPAMYFETKFERPVRFDEFSAAVVPTTTKKEVKEALKNAGVSIFEYDEKSDADRKRAFNEAINSSDNIRFSLKEEKEKIVADAKANGTYMTAPNGEKTKLDAEQWATVRTTNFKNWFGDWENDPENASKVVDENGEPMVVWHGRSAEFNTFEKKEGVRFIMGLEDKVKAEGFFFSPDKGLAEEFASNSSRHRGGKANVVPCFLNIRRPMDLTGEDYDRIYEDVTGWEYMVGMDTQDNLWGIMDEEGMADKIKEKGYDGAIFVEEVDDSYEPTKISYCALDANQIKSAENNNGDFSADNNDIRFSLAGERGAAAADKAEERTFRMDNLSVARKMEEEKKDAKAIKMATGWERGADGKWRYEMPDAKIKDTMDVGGGHIVNRYEDDMLWNGGKLSDVIDAPELFKAYPQLKNVRIETDSIMNDMPSHGEYDSKTNTITIHADELKYMNDILNHEIQHAIQGIEGFAAGGSPTTIRGEVKKRFNEVTKQIKQLRAEGKEDEAKALIEKNRGLYNAYMKNDDFDSYKSLAGEVEARNVQERMNMTPEERRKTLAESTEDVARKDQIFLGVGDVSFSLRDMADGKESGAADMAEDLKSLNTPDDVDDAIKTAIDDMPSGWQMANKKMIHIAQALGENRKAEIAGEEPKFSLKDGTLIKAGTYFSGGGLVEEGLKGIIDPVLAVEYDEKISGVYRNNFGQHIVTADVRDVDPKELVKQIDGEVEYFHASPVCKNYSQAKSNHAEVEIDKETAASTAEFINAVKPKVVTIENVKGYKDSEAMKTITDALDANGYTWDADVYNAADYGGYTNRERLIVRAVRDGKLPAKPKKMAHKSGWYEAVADIIPTLTEKKNGVANWMDVRLKADGIDWRNIDKPLYVMGSAYADGKIPHAFADELLPTLRTKSGDVIVMPDGKVYRAMGRVLARVSGVSDDYKMPFSENLSHTIIGNGIPTQLTEHVIAPLLTGSDPKFSIRTYHGTGASFDKFDFSHMGEGEGSQAFGWGGYVTNSKDIAEDYTRRAKIRKDNGGFEFVTDMSANNKDMVRQYIYKYKDVNKGLDAMRKDLSSALEMFPDDDDLKELSNILAKKNEEIAVPDNIAYLYDVDIPDDNGDYLDWENKLKKSHLNKVNKELVRIGKEPIKTIYPSRVDGKVRGQDLYDELSSMLGSKETASKLLSDAGFVGIKYPAGTIFGGAKEGDYNYVIFDENNANIVGNTRFSLRYDKFEHDLNQWKKDNNLPKDAQRPTIPQRNAGESSVDFLRRVDEYRKQMALWKTAPTYEQHLLSDDTALGEFNRELQKGSVLKRIAFQDSMLAIRKAQEAIMKEVGVDRLNMAEDAYTAENRSHGKGKNEFEEYNNEFLQPLRKAYHQMKKILGDSYDNVRIYMMAKHGLERDSQMAFKKSLESDYEDVAQRSAKYKAYKGDMNRIINDSDLEFGRVDFTTWRQRDNALRVKYSPSYMDYRYDKNGIAYDYSGLSALFDGSDFEEDAYKMVKDIEDKYVAETHNLWDATNAATKKILRDGYKAGMMSKDTYQYVRDMYSHYIPLRGWDGTTADQVWDYIGGGKGAFNQTLKKAHGRTSIADDPIAYIENMAESGILLNNKNWVKQHLMLLAQNHPTSLLTLSKAWYVKSTDANGNEEWIPATPQITSQMDSNQVKAAIDAFEKKMELMAQTGDATQKRDGLNIAYPQTHSEEREHEVRVMKDGEEYVIYVNGDPQLAQAMNNTRAHRVSEGVKNSISKRVIAVVGRKMAAAYTSLSPLFIPSNYFRDLTMTLASTAIREDGRYNYLLGKNLATSWNLGFMLKDYQNGRLKEKVSNGNATPKEQMFYDFMMNGGETGFVSSLDVEDLKKKFKNDLKDLDRWKANPVKVGHTIMDSIEFLNRMIEDSNRFAIYMTSIQYGRSIDEAVNDAKDVTLNFNRKGTGEHSWQTIRNLYLFINPAVQSLQTLGALAKHHPFKFTAVTASWLASGVLVPIVNVALMQLGAAFLGGDGDDDNDWYKDISNKYWQFTKWDRRNNFIMWVPTTHEFVKIPLAQEFRAFYGLGDMIASKMMGGELAEESWEDYGWDLVGQVVDMLPLDPTGYDGELGVSLMPNPIRPVFELAFNVDFTGKPLFKDTEYNKYDPNFTKAYVGTPDWLVRSSRMMNSIGNDYPDVQQNKWDALGNPRYNLNNPAVVDHVLSSYLGGAYTMGSQVLGLLTKSLNDPKEIKVADIPLFSKFVSNPDDRPVTKKQGDEFWNMKENHDRAANTLSKLKKQAKVDGDYSMLERFYGSEEYKQYKQDDVKVKKYEEDKKKERADESGEEYRPHKLNAEDIYKAHATPKDDFEDLKLKQLYTKLNGFKTSYDLLVDTAPSQSDGYYNNNKAAIDAIDEISLDKQEISELKKGFLDDGKDAYNAEDMKQIRDLRKKILSVLEKANKVVVANQKAKAKK